MIVYELTEFVRKGEGEDADFEIVGEPRLVRSLEEAVVLTNVFVLSPRRSGELEDPTGPVEAWALVPHTPEGQAPDRMWIARRTGFGPILGRDLEPGGD